MGRALDKFRDAAKFGFGQLDGHDQQARAESHQFAERSHALAVQQQRLLPAQNAMK